MRMPMRQVRGDADRLASRPVRRRRRTGLHAAWLLAAMMTGGVAGFMVSEHDDLIRWAWTPSVPDEPAIQPAVVAEDRSVAPDTVLTRKPIAIATLHVADVEGRVNSLIDLPLRLEQGNAQQDLLLRIAGVPETAYLTAGQRDAARVWTLRARELDGLKLMVPDIGVPRIDLAVSAVEPETGELVAPAKVMTVALAEATHVEPASAPPPSALPAKPQVPTRLSSIPAPESTGLALPGAARSSNMAAADGLLAAGDAEAARELYQAALKAGAREAAFGMGRSFDPLVHAKYRVRRGKPDAAMAVAWYERAAQAGHAEAIQAIVRLKMRP